MVYGLEMSTAKSNPFGQSIIIIWSGLKANSGKSNNNRPIKTIAIKRRLYAFLPRYKPKKDVTKQSND